MSNVADNPASAEAAVPRTKTMDDIVALCRRRGFIWQSSEIYGGINGFWDYGPLGAALKKNLKDAWRKDIILCPPDGPDGKPIDIVEVDCTIIMHPKVWIASGHAAGFNDPMVDCKTEGCKGRFRADHVPQLQCPLRPSKAPGQHDKCQLTEPRQFNLMFETYCGAVKDEDSKAWLRPETAQGIFTQFWNVVDTSRVKVPFGIAQQGKAFRNEVTPRNFTFRSREFEQMEIEFFITHPDALKPGELTPVEWYQYWRKSRYEWWRSVGLAGDNLQLREHDKDELSHYAKEGAGVCDVEYRFPFTAPGFGELEGIAHRADFDLKAHARHANTGPDGKVNEDKANKLRYFDQERNARYFPHVIEPSAGADRGTLALLCEAYTPDPARPSGVYMKFAPRMAPIKAGVFPLVNKDGMPEVAEKLHKELRGKYAVEFDPKQTIGKRYARMDEAGTPYCFTIDGETLKDQSVTVRERDTLKQERINIGQVAAFLAAKIGT
jgi:glycyl-tRNA synthetase